MILKPHQVRRKRTKPRRGQPTKSEKAAERDRVYARCEGTCELRAEKGRPLHERHIDGWLPKNSTSVLYQWHLVHVHAKRRFGWTEAQGNTLLGGCYWCHIVGMHQQGKKPAEVHRERTA